MLHLVWCVFSISGSAILAYVIRLLIARLIISPTSLALYDEFVGQFVSAVAMMELYVLQFSEHSNLVYFTCLFIMLFLRNLYFTIKGLYESPLCFADFYYQKNRQQSFPIYYIVLVVSIQSVSVLFGQLFTKLVWLFQDDIHINAAEEGCLTTLSHVHSWYDCFSVEMIGTLIYTYIDLMMSYQLRFFTRPLALCIAIFYFGHVTGAWLNPMLATVFTFRCHGHDSDFMHVLVYWIAPFLGFFLAWELRLKLKNLQQVKGKVEGKKDD